MKKQFIYLAGALGFASILAMGGAAGMHIYNTMTAPLTPEQKAAKITEIRLEVEEQARQRLRDVKANPKALPSDRSVDYSAMFACTDYYRKNSIREDAICSELAEHGPHNTPLFFHMQERIAEVK
ncbi:hypothetical protein QK357_28700 [Pseudomonas aeruginosa]|nr:hypothetical protein [Pseudomonas aeruginosa]MDI3591428.1 hypothetical protein [Pseudomonas aeruginosa]MDI3774347.1 hypothetical protein [Pseudomonas aeruginosa]MDI3799978.1 hypothetical protein [Pseudomonas aeruginosa]MDI3853146.1 hypothetical protein [Pseudomonas aeruginosa]